MAADTAHRMGMRWQDNIEAQQVPMWAAGALHTTPHTGTESQSSLNHRGAACSSSSFRRWTYPWSRLSWLARRRLHLHPLFQQVSRCADGGNSDTNQALSSLLFRQKYVVG